MHRKAILVAGLGFGDEGKGTTVDFLTRDYRAHTIIRYNGGAQAGHNVITSDRRQHVFAQFGSGTFIPNVRTHLSRFVVINPKTMVNEENHLRELGITDAFSRTSIDGEAVIATPYHKITNHLREISRGTNRHGSCGLGIGEAISDYKACNQNVVFAKDLKDPVLTGKKLEFIRSKKIAIISKLKLPDIETVKIEIENLYSNRFLKSQVDFYEFFANEYANIVGDEHLKNLLGKNGTVIFEGAQGILLDPKYGFSPHVTKTDITFSNALTLLREAGYNDQIIKIGVLRAYATRHGAGPLPTEDENLTRLLPDSHNPEGPWQGKFRVGYLDLKLAKYALKSIGGIDELVLTNSDRLIGIEPMKICINHHKSQPIYKHIEKLRSIADCLKYSKFIEDSLKIPITIMSLGPTAQDKLVTYPVF